MLFADFLKAAVPAPVTCLGIRLRPLSLGALILMFRFDNEFIANRDLPEAAVQALPLGDLLQGVLACSMDYDKALAELSDPELPRAMELWATKLGFGKRKHWFSRQPVPDLSRIRNAKIIFHQFLQEGLAYPCTKAECGEQRPIGSAWPLLTLTGLMAELHQDISIALNQPLALSRWLVAANGERKGILEVCDRSELSNIKAEADAYAAEVFAQETQQGGA